MEERDICIVSGNTIIYVMLMINEDVIRCHALIDCDYLEDAIAKYHMPSIQYTRYITGGARRFGYSWTIPEMNDDDAEIEPHICEVMAGFIGAIKN
jgi:hypothetical protein